MGKGVSFFCFFDEQAQEMEKCEREKKGREDE
jgi:hypothetical protein